jgi:magnesium transporter
VEIRLITKEGARFLATADVPDALDAGDGIVWIDLHHTNQQGMELLTELVDVRPVDLADCATRSPVPKIHAYADHHYSAINGVARGVDGRLHFQPLKVFLTAHLVVTVLGPTHAALTAEAAHRELTAVAGRIDTQQFCPTTNIELVTAIRFEMLRAQENLVGSAAAAIVSLEQRVLNTDPVRAEALLQDLIEIRHDLQTIGTNSAQTHELYVQLLDTLGSQDTLMRIDTRRIVELRQAFSHLKNTTDLEREYLQEMLDVFQTRASTELNRFVRKITAFGTIGIAWTVMAGIYGMNFAHMPELEWTYGYPAALGAMLLVGVVLAALFRRQGWL